MSLLTLVIEIKVLEKKIKNSFKQRNKAILRFLLNCTKILHLCLKREV